MNETEFADLSPRKRLSWARSQCSYFHPKDLGIGRNPSWRDVQALIAGDRDRESANVLRGMESAVRLLGGLR